MDEEPTGLWSSEDDNSLIVSLKHSGKLVIVSLDTKTVTSQITLGYSPDFVFTGGSLGNDILVAGNDNGYAHVAIIDSSGNFSLIDHPDYTPIDVEWDDNDKTLYWIIYNQDKLFFWNYADDSTGSIIVGESPTDVCLVPGETAAGLTASGRIFYTVNTSELTVRSEIPLEVRADSVDCMNSNEFFFMEDWWDFTSPATAVFSVSIPGGFTSVSRNIIFEKSSPSF